MTSRHTIAIFALLAFTAISAAANGAAPALAPAASQLLDSPAAIDFGDGPRVALTRLAAGHGVIVTITGECVNVIRPDGSELRLKGSQPDDPTPLGEPPTVLLRRGDAWVQVRDLTRLLGATTEAAPAGVLLFVGDPESAPPPLTSFSIPKPLVVRPPEEAPSNVPSRPHLPIVRLSEEAGGAITDIAPVEVGLDLNSVTSFVGPGMTGFYQEIVGPAWSAGPAGPRDLRRDSPTRRTLSYVSLDIDEGDRTFLLGDLSDPLFGTTTGIDIHSHPSPGTSLGAAVLVPSQQPGTAADGRIALHADTHSSIGLSTAAVLASDGSYLLSGTWEHPGASLTSRLRDCFGLKQQEFAWEGRPLPAVSLYGRFARAEGGYDASADLTGLQWRLGRARLGLEQARGTSAGEPWGMDSVSLSVHGKQAAGTIRYLRPAGPTGREGLEWYLSRFDTRGRQLFLSSSAPARGEWDGGRSYRLGTSLPLRPDLRLRAALDWADGVARPEWKIEWRPSRDRVIALRYGPLDTGRPDGPTDNAFVLQAGLGFGSSGVRPRGAGRIVGHVRDDRGRGVADVAVMLEKVTVTFTRSDGSFEFSNVEPGRRTVRLDPERLHAHLGGSLHPRVVHVTNGAVEQADFVLTRLCRIAGVVRVQFPSGEPDEPLAGAVVELGNGRTATTDSLGRYSIGGLEPGRYTVSLTSTLDASRLIPISPTSWSLSLAPGDRVDAADFVLEKRTRPIVFGALPAASEPDP